ncbi:hypothetical protein D3C77_385200 [compost metagenome]
MVVIADIETCAETKDNYWQVVFVCCNRKVNQRSDCEGDCCHHGVSIVSDEPTFKCQKKKNRKHTPQKYIFDAEVSFVGNKTQTQYDGCD